MHLSPGQRTVLTAFQSFDQMDDVILTVYVHHIADSPMSSSGIRTRRAELVRKGCLRVVGTKTLKSGRPAAVFGITAKGRRALVQRKRTARKATAAV